MTRSTAEGLRNKGNPGYWPSVSPARQIMPCCRYEWLSLHMPTPGPKGSIVPGSPISSERLVAPQRLQVHTV